MKTSLSKKSAFTNSALALFATLALAACGAPGGGSSKSTAVVDTNSPTTTVEGASPTADGSSSKLLKAPTQDLGSMDVTPAAPPASAPEKKPEPKPEQKPVVGPDAKPQAPTDPKSPATIEVTAHPNEALKVTPTNSGDKIVSTLSANLVVDGVAPHVENSILNLVGVEHATILIPELGKCELVSKNFDMRDAGKTIAFTLQGIDDKAAPTPDGCLVKLSTMSMAGFVVEFKNVRLGGPLSETYVPVVHLTVAPFKTDAAK